MEMDELYIALGLKADKGSFEEGHDLVGKLKEGLEYFAGFEAVKGLGELVEHTVEATVENKHLAERLGVSIESVQQLGYAADVSGSNVNELRVGLQHLTLGVEHAKKSGDGLLVAGLSKLHMSLASIKDGDLDEKLMKIADGFANAGPHVDKTAASMEIFGTRIGPKLLPLLNKGADGIAELREEFVKLGAQTDGETAEAMEKLEEDQKRLKYAWGGIKDELVAGLVPALKDMLEGLLQWVAANRELIAHTLQGVISALIVGFKVLGTVVAGVVQVIDFFTVHAEAGRAVLIAFGAIITMVAAEAAVAWLAALWPFALVAAVVAGLALLFEEFGDTIVAIAIPVGIAVGIMFGSLFGIGIAIAAATYLIIEYIDDIEDAFDKAWEGIKQAAKAAFEWIVDLPIIKQLIEVYEYFEGKTKTGLDNDESSHSENFAKENPEKAAEFRQDATENPMLDNPGLFPEVYSSVHNDVQIDIHTHPGMDGEGVANKIDEHLNKLTNDTHAGLGGH